MTGCRLVVTDEQERIDVPEELLRRVLDAGCRSMERTLSVSLALVDDETMSRLHERYLGIPGPTDVLSFPLGADPDLPDPGSGPGSEPELDGEIVVSTDTAHRTADRLGIDPVVEVCLYALHGLLHLLGHDDHDPEDFERMHGLEREILIREMGIDPRVLEGAEGHREE